MSTIDAVTSAHTAAPKSSPRAADQTAANTADAARSGAIAQLSAARGQADPGAIRTAEQMLATATAAATTAGAWVDSDSGLNVMA